MPATVLNAPSVVPADPAQTPASTISPDLAEQIEAVRATLPGTCDNGSSYCTKGRTQHVACVGPTVSVYVPGGSGPAPTLDAQIINCGDGDAPELSFSGNSYDGVAITSAQLRTVVADVRNHLDRLLAIADQYDALFVATESTPAATETTVAL